MPVCATKIIHHLMGPITASSPLYSHIDCLSRKIKKPHSNHIHNFTKSCINIPRNLCLDRDVFSGLNDPVWEAKPGDRCSDGGVGLAPTCMKGRTRTDAHTYRITLKLSGFTASIFIFRGKKKSTTEQTVTALNTLIKCTFVIWGMLNAYILQECEEAGGVGE